MRFDDHARPDPSQLGGRGPRPNPLLAVGGAAGAIVVIVIALLFGVDPGRVLGGGAAGPGPTAALSTSIQSYWRSALPGYTEVSVRTFRGSTATRCGTTTSAVGTFYCPADTTIYLDLGVLDQLGARGGDAAVAYVLAHEVGHHVQQLNGTLRRVQASPADTGPTSPAVRLELQADCYAGVWFAHAKQDAASPVAKVTPEDLDRALESWTHSSAANRQTWLRRGFQTGDPDRCDTFAARTLGG